MADFFPSGGGVPSNVPRVVEIDTTSVTVTETSATLKKTYSGLVFANSKLFKVTVFFGSNTGTTGAINPRLYDGTNETNLGNISITYSSATRGMLVFYISQYSNSTTVAVVNGHLGYVGIDALSRLGNACLAEVTLAGSSTWSAQHTIRLYALTGSGSELYLRYVIVEEVSI